LDELCDRYPPPPDEGEDDEEGEERRDEEGVSQVHASGFLFSKPPRDFFDSGAGPGPGDNNNTGNCSHLLHEREREREREGRDGGGGGLELRLIVGLFQGLRDGGDGGGRRDWLRGRGDSVSSDGSTGVGEMADLVDHELEEPLGEEVGRDHRVGRPLRGRSLEALSEL
jgi:hypothetical protein